MTTDIRTESHTSRPTLVVQRQGSLQDLPKIIPASCGDVWNVVRAQQIEGAGRNLAFFLDDVIHFEVGVEFDGTAGEISPLIISKLPAGTVATAAHIGPYNTLSETHWRIRHWCDDHGRLMAGPNWEIYGHWKPEWNTQPAEIRTDVFYLLK